MTQVINIMDENNNLISSLRLFHYTGCFSFLRKIIIFLYLFIFGCTGPLLLCRLSSSCGEPGPLSSCDAGSSLRQLLLLTSLGSRVHRLQQLQHVGSAAAAPRLQSPGWIIVACRLSCSSSCGIFLDWESNLCLLQWQADSLPLNHQGSPGFFF